ncbi:protein kinase family protein [Sanguibacter sp. HDW7]|uniref:protein kinase family protein n=1 Tax=Sanguibacter sp. HDW7 TaxID=2714931 RepID=UPI001408A7C0|nr:protein kinase family protein [Sanguibacter sp. HDW7]QIK83179.1 protein kinase family protein [Sanguibacter sp. HDW7]
MATPNEMRIADLRAKYEEQSSSAAFDRLYTDEVEFGHMFSALHEQLNEHFEAINGRAHTTHHYWADNSRTLLALIKDIKDDLYSLKRAGIDVTLDQRYQDGIERCQPWLSYGGGSTVPEDFTEIEIIKYEPAFMRSSATVLLANQRERVDLKMVGSGSFANVHSYIDPEYGIRFAVKRAKSGIAERDLERFKREFDIMKRLSFPYIVEVYRYNEGRDEYRMEFCDDTLRAYIRKRNATLKFSTRKRIALQFLYGLNYIHGERVLHRDVSLQNVLVKTYSSGAVIVKLSDFGLSKEADSDFTLTKTELKGTIRDPQLESLKEYSTVNEIYAIGWVLHYIFTGKESLSHGTDPVANIVKRCTDRDPASRYQTVLELIADVETLAPGPTDAPA